MSWNHRVWVESVVGEPLYSVRETYYNAQGNVTACTAEPESVSSDSLEYLAATLTHMLAAVNAVRQGAEVLELDNFEFAERE